MNQSELKERFDPWGRMLEKAGVKDVATPIWKGGAEDRKNARGIRNIAGRSESSRRRKQRRQLPQNDGPLHKQSVYINTSQQLSYSGKAQSKIYEKGEENTYEHTSKLFQKSARCADGGDDGIHHDAEHGLGG